MLRRPHVFGLVLLALAATPCSADIYGHVDESGAHVSAVKLDSRYKLYMKSKAPEKAEAAPHSARTAAENLEAGKIVASIRQGQRYTGIIARVAREQKIEPALLHAVIMVESAYNARARSPKGATGLMQLMPATGKRYGAKNLLNPLENVRAGARYLSDLLALFDNNLGLVLAAYNAGEGAVRRSGNAIPPYPETRAYVPRVLRQYEMYLAQAQSPYATSRAAGTTGAAAPAL